MTNAELDSKIAETMATLRSNDLVGAIKKAWRNYSDDVKEEERKTRRKGEKLVDAVEREMESSPCELYAYIMFDSSGDKLTYKWRKAAVGLFGKGDVELTAAEPGKAVSDAAALLDAGRVLYDYAKILLPFYDVFDESRYFEPGTTPGRDRDLRRNGRQVARPARVPARSCPPCGRHGLRAGSDRGAGRVRFRAG